MSAPPTADSPGQRRATDAPSAPDVAPSRQPRTTPVDPPARTRAEWVADAAIDLLVERGTRGLTHRAVDEAAGLPQGSTSNHARTRAALLELTLSRLAVRESQALLPEGMSAIEEAGALAEVVSQALHLSLSRHRSLVIARYELALEATRRPELRALYDRTGTSLFREPLVAMLTAAGSAEPERHSVSVISWCEGVLFSHTVGASHTVTPSQEWLRRGAEELLRGLLPG